MDFARKQLEKYGWTDGKGLGKNENGISEALKPKLKRSVAGIGHDPASEFNEHWWTALYDKAAGNIEVKEKNNKTKRIKVVKEFEITNSTWKLNNDYKKSKEKYSDNFVRTAVLTSGGSKTENVRDPVEVKCEMEKKDVFQMTDEELFRACEGRTAHKGARHGLKALGKLARIALQEEMLLKQPQYNSYSKKKSVVEEVVENINLEAEEVKHKKKKKKKRCLSVKTDTQNNGEEIHVVSSLEETPESHKVSVAIIKTAGVNNNQVKEKRHRNGIIGGLVVENSEKTNFTNVTEENEANSLKRVHSYIEAAKEVCNKQKKKRYLNANITTEIVSAIEENKSEQYNVVNVVNESKRDKLEKSVNVTCEHSKENTKKIKNKVIEANVEVEDIHKPKKKKKRKNSENKCKDVELDSIRDSSFVKKKKRKCK